MSAPLTRKATMNLNGVSHEVTVLIGNGQIIISGQQFNDILISYNLADGTSVEADVQLPGFTPYNGQE